MANMILAPYSICWFFGMFFLLISAAVMWSSNGFFFVLGIALLVTAFVESISQSLRKCDCQEKAEDGVESVL